MCLNGSSQMKLNATQNMWTISLDNISIVTDTCLIVQDKSKRVFILIKILIKN